jgi:hypothetical protein
LLGLDDRDTFYLFGISKCCAKLVEILGPEPNKVMQEFPCIEAFSAKEIGWVRGLLV